jgi:hypothetical protein
MRAPEQTSSQLDGGAAVCSGARASARTKLLVDRSTSPRRSRPNQTSAFKSVTYVLNLHLVSKWGGNVAHPHQGGVSDLPSSVSLHSNIIDALGG